MVDATLSVLQKALEMRMREHEIHASNIANANVPNYKARKLDFEGRLREAIAGLDGAPNEPLLAREARAEAQVPSVAPDIYEDPTAVASGDGNTVNAEREQTALAKNTVAYETLVEMMKMKFAMQKMAISEGGR